MAATWSSASHNAGLDRLPGRLYLPEDCLAKSRSLPHAAAALYLPVCNSLMLIGLRRPYNNQNKLGWVAVRPYQITRGGGWWAFHIAKPVALRCGLLLSSPTRRTTTDAPLNARCQVRDCRDRQNK